LCGGWLLFWEVVVLKNQWQDLLELGAKCQELFVDTTRVPEIESLGIQMSGISTMLGSFCLERVNPNNHTLLYTIEGSGQVTTPYGTEIIEEQTLTTLPAGVPFNMTLNSQKWKLVWFNVNDTAHWRSLCECQPLNQPSRQCQSIYHALSLIYHESSQLLRTGCLNQLVHYLHESLEPLVTASQGQRRLEVLFLQVEQQLQSAWSIEQLCTLAYYSAPHLHRLCQLQYGRSPMQQVIFFRMERAKYLLRHSDFSISHIAERVGYQEVSNFSKRFSKSVGQSPKQYRT
jgi:AraC-like DNA-binding protein